MYFVTTGTGLDLLMYPELNEELLKDFVAPGGTVTHFAWIFACLVLL